jgi:hypothetical protein
VLKTATFKKCTFLRISSLSSKTALFRLSVQGKNIKKQLKNALTGGSSQNGPFWPKTPKTHFSALFDTSNNFFQLFQLFALFRQNPQNLQKPPKHVSNLFEALQTLFEPLQSLSITFEKSLKTFQKFSKP